MPSLRQRRNVPLGLQPEPDHLQSIVLIARESRDMSIAASDLDFYIIFFASFTCFQLSASSAAIDLPLLSFPSRFSLYETRSSSAELSSADLDFHFSSPFIFHSIVFRTSTMSPFAKITLGGSLHKNHSAELLPSSHDFMCIPPIFGRRIP